MHHPERTTSAGNGSLRAAHVEGTRRALLDTARRLFTENGFQATRTEEIAEQAGLTRGALYHHFKDKEDLFRAVHEEVVGEVAPLLWRRSTGVAASAWALFRANSEIYLEAASTNAAYRQIVLIDGPAVLGWQHLTELGNGPTLKIAEYLRDAVDEGVLAPSPSIRWPTCCPPSAPARRCTSRTPRIPRRPGARSPSATTGS